MLLYKLLNYLKHILRHHAKQPVNIQFFSTKKLTQEIIYLGSKASSSNTHELITIF